MIDISIIIVSFNTKNLTLQCIKSAEEEGSSLKKEIIMVDNGSTDGSVAEFAKLQKSKTPEIRLVKNKRNVGFAKAVNQGIRKAKGEYILLLNSDTKVKSGAFSKLVKFAKRTPDAGVVGARLFNPNGSVQASCYKFPTIIKTIQQYWLGEQKWLDKFAPRGKQPVVVDVVVGAAFLITFKARELVGLLDERYFMYFEDFDYCRRVWNSGLKVYYLPAAQVVHHHGASGGNNELLIKSSKIYHGLLGHYLMNIVIWLGQKWQKLFH
jgi:GT2 family glycosyltransferase